MSLPIPFPKPARQWVERIFTPATRAMSANLAANENADVIARLVRHCERCRLADDMPCLRLALGPQVMKEILFGSAHAKARPEMIEATQRLGQHLACEGVCPYRPVDGFIDYECFARHPQPGYWVEGNELLLNGLASRLLESSRSRFSKSVAATR